MSRDLQPAMPFRLRLRRTRRYNVLSKNYFVTRIRLLDNNVIECTLSVESTGQECLEAVAQRLELREGPCPSLTKRGYLCPLFSAEERDTAHPPVPTPPAPVLALSGKTQAPAHRWVELEKPLKKQLDKFGNEPLLFFGVMFYVPSVSRLEQEATSHTQTHTLCRSASHGAGEFAASASLDVGKVDRRNVGTAVHRRRRTAHSSQQKCWGDMKEGAKWPGERNRSGWGWLIRGLPRERNGSFANGCNDRVREEGGVKKAVLDGRLHCTVEQGIRLAGLAVQADFGDFTQFMSQDFLREYVLFPVNWPNGDEVLEEWTQKVANEHKSRCRMQTAEAELLYIKEVEKLDGFGQESFPAKDNYTNDIFIGVSFIGVFVKHRNGRSIMLHKWKDIGTIAHNKSAITVEITSKDDTIIFHMEDMEMAKYIARLFTARHKFYKQNKICAEPTHSPAQIRRRTTWTHRLSLPRPQSCNFQSMHSQYGEHHQDTQSSQDSIFHDEAYYKSETSLDRCPAEFPFRNGTVPNGSMYSSPSLSSLNHSQTFVPPSPMSSNLSIPSSELMRPDYIPSHRHSAIIAPSYRPTPEYDAVMRQKRRMLPAHHDLHSQSLRSLNISNACAYRQPEALVYSQPEMRERSPYHGLGPSPGPYAPQISYSKPVSHGPHQGGPATSQGPCHSPCVNGGGGGGVGGGVGNSISHTVSTPELANTKQQGNVGSYAVTANVLRNHMTRPPPPYPSSSFGPATSTPDLASHRHRCIGGSSPELVTRMVQLSVKTFQPDSSAVVHQSLQEVSEPLTAAAKHRSTLGKRHSMEVISSMRGGGGMDGLVMKEPDLTSVKERVRKEPVKERPVSEMFSLEDSIVEREIAQRTLERQKMSVDSMKRPLMMAALNGLYVARMPVAESPAEEGAKAATDERCKTLELKLEEERVFTEYEQVPKKRTDCVLTTATLPENTERNRFRDVVPYEENRVELVPNKENNTGYINASHIKVMIRGEEWHYIATQGPLANTCADFWQMVWEQGVNVIAMVTAEEEGGRPKSHRYWPKLGSKHNSATHGKFKVTTKFRTDSGCYATTGLKVKHLLSGQERTVWHLQYTDWPEQGCPEYVQGFLSYLEEIQSVRRHTNSMLDTSKSLNPPVVVHCSAGVGRTGVVILTELMISCLEHNEPVEVPTMLSELRQQRMLMVQTISQYKFVYQVLIQFLKNSRLI
ncbi:hypothetical protein JOQ06_004351 [Pogonophryne albipinna]|uniref:protein-tyrosine-phosphatase n=1 Tax=Pogonophryne albipinna TaxID=1090488 RepID=A0AAD6FCD7_9TELE|nr:hypothetical protein JOQ06_004351 [Pogonophryne albipinna]